jgi:hypothetical protein
MRELIRLLTPPEWFEWGWVARIVYVAVFVGLMIPVTMFAHWVSDLLFPNW